MFVRLALFTTIHPSAYSTFIPLQYYDGKAATQTSPRPELSLTSLNREQPSQGPAWTRQLALSAALANYRAPNTRVVDSYTINATRCTRGSRLYPTQVDHTCCHWKSSALAFAPLCKFLLLVALVRSQDLDPTASAATCVR